jgi:hypothetical protein
MLLFLWWPEGDLTLEPAIFRMTVHLFGARSSPACATYGLRYLALLFREHYPLGSNLISRDFYVDDGVGGATNIDQALRVAIEAKKICSAGGLNLCKFTSNHKELVEMVSGSQDPQEEESLVFGIRWETNQDTIGLAQGKIPQAATRREALTSIASIFDPLGLVSPVVLKGKLLLQQLCRGGIGWDDTIPEPLREAWSSWLEELQKIPRIRLPRQLLPLGFAGARLEIHNFSDASSLGYGQCSYLRVVTDMGFVTCSLLFSKARVAPQKPVSIPRLELTAAVVNARVGHMLKMELNPWTVEEFYWTDSMVVLGYLKNKNRKFHVFVANRIQEILSKTHECRWFHVSTDQNPADIASRGSSCQELKRSSWFSGPPFLSDSGFVAPECIAPEPSVDDPEVKANAYTVNTLDCNPNILARVERFSSWHKLITAFAVLIRKARSFKMSKVAARKAAEAFLLRLAQTQHPELATLPELESFEGDDGVIRIQGRLSV